MVRRLFRNLFLLCVLWACAPQADAQVNTERLRIGEDVDGFSGLMDGDLTFNSGNVELLQAVIGGRLDFAFQPHLLFLVGNIRYGERTGAAFQNAGFMHLRYNYRYRTWLTHEAFTQIEYNQFTLLERRMLLGSGIRFRIFRADEDAVVYYGSSYMLEDERLNLERAALPTEHTAVHRWSNYLTAQVRLNELVYFINTGYAQPRFDDFGDIRVLNEATLNVQINQRIALRTTAALRYDRRPPPTVKSLDVSIRNGLTFRF